MSWSSLPGKHYINSLWLIKEVFCAGRGIMDVVELPFLFFFFEQTGAEVVFCGEVSLISNQATLYELPEQEEKRSASVRIRFYLRFISNTSCCLSVRLQRNFTNAGLFGGKKCCFVFFLFFIYVIKHLLHSCLLISKPVVDFFSFFSELLVLYLVSIGRI